MIVDRYVNSGVNESIVHLIQNGIDLISLLSKLSVASLLIVRLRPDSMKASVHCSLVHFYRSAAGAVVRRYGLDLNRQNYYVSLT